MTIDLNLAKPKTINFNSHAHVERDFLVILYIYHSCDFNSHAHVERDSQFFHMLQAYFNFNSHAHVERDISVGSVGHSMGISTHTLTWSVTI